MVKNPYRQKTTLKKTKLILTFILCTLLLFSSITTSLARQKTDIGVEVGETYEWTLKLYILNYITLIRNEGGSEGQFEAEIVSMNLQGESIIIPVHLEAIIQNSVFPAESFFDVTVEIDMNTIGLAPDFNISQIPIFFPLDFPIKPSLGQVNYSIFKGDKSSYFSDPHRFLLITATGVNWTDAAALLNTHLRRHLISSNFTVSPQNNGLKIVRLADTTTLASELNLNYDEKGVLETADGSYNGSPLFTLELLSEETDDGNNDDTDNYRIAFEPNFLLSVLAVAIVILVIRKRKSYKFNS